MVRILSNGDIVADDDQRGNASPASGSPQQQQRPRQGYVQHEEAPMQQQLMGAGSVFDNLSQRLADAGVPRWNLGPYTVEPIVSLGFLLALLFMGLKGLLFAGVLFFVAKYSQEGMGRGQGVQGRGQGQRPASDRPDRGSGDGGRNGWSGGNRLGR